ncbi:MAG: ATP-binding protein [Planctomycetes bacterium]|nr:ATP-binding protein [Planctomycetota bacterium]
MDDIHGIMIGVGAAVAAFAILHTAFSRQRRAARLQRDLLQAVIDTTPGLVALRDQHGRYLLVNHAYARFFGRSAQELIGCEVGAVRSRHEAARIRAEDEVLLRDGGEIDCERRWLGAGGMCTVRTIKRPIDLPGGGRGVVVVANDITALKQAVDDAELARTAAEDAARAKSVFLATMSHEIRTPLNGVLGMCQLLMRTRLDPDQSDYACTAMSSGQALLTLINNILDFTKIESEKIEIELQPCDLRRLVHEVLLLMPAKDGEVEYLVEVAPEIPREIQIDPVRLRQVLLNLVGNAAKFTDRGHVLVRVARNGERFQLTVEDTGCGIAQTVLPRLFQPFVQADSGTTRRHGGTGLGLAISQRLAGLMGGSIVVTSETGVGSRFILDLPLRHDDASTAARARPPAGTLVLLAGVSAIGAGILRRQMETAQLVVEEAAIAELVGRVGALAADGSRPGAVVLDGSPAGGCHELAARLTAAAGAPVPLVLLLPFFQRGSGSGPELGCAASVAKPVDEDALLSVLAEVTTHPHRTAAARYKGVPTPRPQPEQERIPARVLVAEDDPVSRRLAGLILDGLGATAVLVEDGRAAMEASVDGGFDIVLMDVDMPVMDGYTATGAIRALETGRGRRTPIIALTANALEGDREHCLQAGMDDYLSKPVTIESVAAMVRKWVVK